MNLIVSWSQIAAFLSAVIVIQGAVAYHFECRFNDLIRFIDARFETVGVRLKGIEDRLDEIEKRLDGPRNEVANHGSVEKGEIYTHDH